MINSKKMLSGCKAIVIANACGVMIPIGNMMIARNNIEKFAAANADTVSLPFSLSARNTIQYKDSNITNPGR